MWFMFFYFDYSKFTTFNSWIHDEHKNHQNLLVFILIMCQLLSSLYVVELFLHKYLLDQR